MMTQADFCPADYETARRLFIKLAQDNKQTTRIDSLPLKAKGPSGPLTIDLAILGNLTSAKKILFHISGTHGVEGGSGSGIQQEFLTNTPILPEDTAIIIIHILNPFGMAYNRRVNERNVDLNRNCCKIEERVSPKLYETIDPLLNPRIPKPFDFSLLKTLCDAHGWPEIRAAIVKGQYHYPNGLFYGGFEVEEGPSLVLEWCRAHLSDASHVKFGIIDVHTGLGPFAVDTLLTDAPPTDIMMEHFGDKLSVAKQMSTAGYDVTGAFTRALSDLFSTTCSFSITQEFGAIPEDEVLQALYLENSMFHHSTCTYDPSGEGGQAMLKAFYPSESIWRHQVVSSGRELILKSLELLNRCGITSGNTTNE
jgi:hypothetical protein